MQGLINDLLAFSRVGRLTPADRVDLDRCARPAIAEPGRRDRGDRRHGHRRTLPTVAASAPLLATALQNLIGNAIKFRRPDEPPADRG